MLGVHRLATTALIVALAVASGLTVNPRPALAGDSFLEGLDVSSWQARPRWLEVKNSGIRFVIARATFNNAGIDTEYGRNRNLLRQREIPFSAYHHAQPDANPGDAIAEANHFVDVAGLNGRNLLPALDLKTNGGLDVETLQAWVTTWLAHVEERLGVKPMIYAPTVLWVNSMGDTTWFADNGYRFWVRDLGATSPTLPANDWGGQGWTLWQYAIAPVPGIRGKVDRNYFNGTILAPLRIKNNR